MDGAPITVMWIDEVELSVLAEQYEDELVHTVCCGNTTKALCGAAVEPGFIDIVWALDEECVVCNELDESGRTFVCLNCRK